MRAATLWEIVICLCFGVQLSLEAYWRRIRAGRNPIAPTYDYPLRTLPRASLSGRRLPSELFVRPTRDADSHAPEVVALADELRAKTRNDQEYVSAIFDYVSSRIDQCLDFPPRGNVVGTLARGFGTCHEKLNLFIALARAGGIPARYCTIATAKGQTGVLSLMGDDDGVFGMLNFSSRRFLLEENDARAKRIVSFMLTWSAAIRRRLKARAQDTDGSQPPDPWQHYIAELRIGESWIPADPTYSDEDCVALNLPFQQFGYEPFLLSKMMGTTINARMESIPFRRRRFLFWFAFACVWRGHIDHLNHFSNRLRSHGRQMLAKEGRDAMILKRPHLYRRLPVVTFEGA
jgi:hypothetical protein